MHALGIVAEYNPFHTGHAYHIEKAKKETAADGVIAVMSGNFVQRGEPAILDKWTRAFHAISGGVDLVLELPTVYALSSAEGFARGAIETLKSTGIVRTLSFGSECGDIALLKRAANILEEDLPHFREVLQKELREGRSYAAARMVALAAIDAEAAKLLLEPNNILGVHYLRFAKDLAVHTVKREGSGYLAEEIEEGFPSAMALRQKLLSGEPVGAYVKKPIAVEELHTLEEYADLILYAVKATNWQAFETIPDAVKKRIASADTSSLSALLESAKTRHIPMATLKRALLQILLQNTRTAEEKPQYIRALGFTDRGQEILKEMKKTAHLPIITRPAAFSEPSPIWELENRATDIYFLGERRVGENIRRAPVKA